MDVQIHFPSGFWGANNSDDFLSAVLRQIAVKYYQGDEHNWDDPGKYGCKYEDDTFFMCPDYMDIECDCGFDELSERWHKAHPHKKNCYCKELRRRGYDMGETGNLIAQQLCAERGIPWNDGYGSAVHCDCGHQQLADKWFAENGHAFRCPHRMPNFWYKPTNLEVRWYKYIGREMKVSQPTTIGDVAEIAIKLLGRTVEQVAAEHERDSQERAEALTAMFERLKETLRHHLSH